MFSKTTPNSNLFQNKLKLMSLSKVWNENERFKLVFTKLLVFTAKTGSINSGTGREKTVLHFPGQSRPLSRPSISQGKTSFLLLSAVDLKSAELNANLLAS
jgi:hypothetical protein